MKFFFSSFSSESAECAENLIYIECITNVMFIIEMYSNFNQYDSSIETFWQSFTFVLNLILAYA